MSLYAILNQSGTTYYYALSELHFKLVSEHHIKIDREMGNVRTATSSANQVQAEFINMPD